MVFVKSFFDIIKSTRFANHQSFGFNFIGQPTQGVWSHFALLQGKKQIGALLLTVKGQQAKNFGYECLAQLQSQLPIVAEKLYQSLELLIKKAQQTNYQLEFSLVLTEGRKLILASLLGGVYLERSQKRGSLIKPLEELQFLLGSKYPSDKIWLYTASAKKIMFLLDSQLQEAKELGTINHLLLSSTVAADQALALLVFNKELFDELAEDFVDSQVTNTNLAATQYRDETKPLVTKEVLDSKSKPPTTWKFWQCKKFLLDFFAIFKRVQSIFFLLAGNFFLKLTKLRLSFVRPKIRGLFWWLGSDKVYLSEQIGKKTMVRIGLFFGLIALILAIVIALFYKQFQARAKVDTLLQPRYEKLESLLKFATDQPVLAKKQAEDLQKELIADKSRLDATEYGRVQLEILTQKLDSYLAEIVQMEFKDIPIFDDLRRLSPAFITTKAAASGAAAIFVDIQQQLLVFYALPSKSAELVVLDSPMALKAVAATANQKIVLAEGLVQLDQIAGKLTLKTLVSKGDSNQDGTLLTEFKTNLYVFNPVRRNVFRYIEQGTGYSKPVGWFATPPSIDFNGIASMVVDGDLWLGTKQGEILKFSSGKQVDFVLTDLLTAFHSEIQLATAPDNNYLYVLEPAENRVVVLDKQGKFITQTISPLLGSVTQLIFFQTEKLLLAVSGSILYQIPL